MPQLKLTKSAIDALRPSTKNTVYWDVGLPSFGVKITPKGRKVFIVLYRVAGGQSRLRKFTIGPYGRVTLAMARGQAQKIFAARVEGRDPAAEKTEARRRSVVDRISDLTEAFIEDRLKHLKTAKQLAASLRRDVIPIWGAKSVRDIKRRDIVDLITGVGQRGSAAARKLLKLVKSFFRWCLGRGVIDTSPADDYRLSQKEKSRDRALDDSELVAVILAARTMRSPFGQIVEILALTGQRREEVAQMSLAEIDENNRSWRIPSARSKNDKAHIIHLSSRVWEIIQAMPRTIQLIFATPGGYRFQDFSRFKIELDRLSGVSGWRLHDLRRTVVTGMARLGVAPHIADKVLNHQSGTISGVAAVYQRHEFLSERKQALELWAIHVGSLLDAHLCQVTKPRSAAA